MNYKEVLEFLKAKKDYFSNEEYERTIKAIESAQYNETINNENIDSSLIYKEKGNEEFKKGNYTQAMEYYTQSINENPNNEILYSNRAACLTKLNRLEEAIQDCLKAIEINPKFLKGYIRLGGLYTSIDVIKAIEYYEQGLAIDPNNVICKNNIDILTGKKEKEKVPDVTELLNNPEIMNMVKDITKNKSPEEIAELIKNFGGFKQ
ncbi:Stress-induced-phosphoprotein 1 [Astathelohania contejeani]|uniref:Stress-induced-phosphoprotein 1 n=1 Tax=Astathelohania contejeani TaxID=164912 RepID=A0ABQ7HVR5_9MICR|nr:Stress-induced-phosphoprotein 1 [Thelohania contejeani]